MSRLAWRSRESRMALKIRRRMPGLAAAADAGRDLEKLIRPP
jgi:hypothetical protein